jgi:hypothetical protein
MHAKLLQALGHELASARRANAADARAAALLA